MNLISNLKKDAREYHCGVWLTIDKKKNLALKVMYNYFINETAGFSFYISDLHGKIKERISESQAKTLIKNKTIRTSQLSLF